MTDIDKAGTEEMRELIKIDDEIEVEKWEMRNFCKAKREKIKVLEAKKKQKRNNLSQLPLFGGVDG